MSGDVQPRKRKDKKKKKDDLGVEEPRGTAAAFGDGDVFMHSQSEHGTGGHWCAKVIFFSLLAVLITLIGLIILENRGLTELEANSVESRYSGVLEGWIEDAPDDDHHDEHTLELKHHDEDDADHGSELEDDDHENDDDDNDEHENDEEHDNDDDEDEDADDEDENDEEEVDQHNEEVDQDDDGSEEVDKDDDEGSEEQDLNAAEDEDDIEEPSYRKYYKGSEKVAEDIDDDDDDDEDLLKEGDDDTNEDDIKYRDDDIDDDDDANNQENDNDNQPDDDDDEKQDESDEDKNLKNNDDDDSNEDDYLQNDSHEDEDEHKEEEEPANIEIEAIEKEVSDDDDVSAEEPAQEEEEHTEEASEELSANEDDTSVEDDDVEFLEPDELDELPIAEPITVPKGKPLAEVGESPSIAKPQDTLADEEEYERQQEELRKEREQASQGMWLKLTVGGALLVATHAVLRRATASRETDTEDEPEYREETPLSDRRMTLISEPVPPPTVAPKLPEVSRPIEREVIREPVIVQSSPPPKDEIEDEEEEEEIIISKPALPVETAKKMDKELYSDEEEIEEEIEEEEETEPIKPQKAVPQTPQIPDVTKEVTPEPDEDDDVEIIDEEQLEEELEEEEISDVDDAELLSRLEEKYGRLPEEKRAQKDGGNSIEDEWPGEPEDSFWSEHLEQAQRELRQGEWMAAAEKASAPKLQSSARARYLTAQALDAAAEAKKDNQLLNKAIAAYLEVLKMSDRLSDKKLLEVATRTLDRIKFRGTYLSAEPVYKLLIRRFPNEPAYRNNMTISLLMANRADLAENVLTETLKIWPNDRVALAHHGFILKTLHNRLEEAVEALTKALEGDAGAANEPRFYYHLGDALLLLGRFEKAHEVHKRGAALGHFLSPSQRSLYNVDRLKSRPWWNVNETPYSRIARALEKSWKDILKEGEAARELYEKEKEGLKERGDWSQLDLFVRGREIPKRCARAPVTCGIVKSETAVSGCRRGQIKFSMMEAGTHVRPHVGPTNCRLRMHLGLSNTKDTFIRVDRETRQWQTGKVLMFDDSFEHEVWHNGTGTRLVLIVDVWHPDLTLAERRQLPAI